MTEDGIYNPPAEQYQIEDRLPHGAGFLICIPVGLCLWALILGGIGAALGWWR